MSARGSFICYEPMTSDATAPAKFYGAVGMMTMKKIDVAAIGAAVHADA
jgi:hypothetical protein